MPNSKANKAYTLRMTKQAQKPSKNDKPSQFKKVGDFRPGGMFSTGRAIKAQPETRKKASVSAAGAGASKEKRTPGLRVRGMDDAGPVVRAGVGSKAKSTPKKKVAVASKGQSIRSADKASDAKRRKSGTTRGSRGMY